jgi:hypothetical protein
MLKKLQNRITKMLRWRGADLDVTMADDWCCCHCFKALRPSAVRRDPVLVAVICENCHTCLLHVELLHVEPL